MPLYIYQSEDGQEVERFFHRDPPTYIRHEGQTLKRTEVTRFAAPSLPEPTQGDSMLEGYHAQECDKGSRFRSRFSAETIKRAWANDVETPADRGEILNPS